MRTILLTGLDGSGKSTFLDKVKSELAPDYDVLFSPFIHAKDFEGDKELNRICNVVNSINSGSDVADNPRIKAVALLASMLLFKRLHNYKANLGTKILVCERHPLIDASVYAKFYAPQAGKNLDDPELDELNEQHGEDLETFVALLPKEYDRQEKKPAHTILAFLYQWFHLESKVDIPNGESLFGIRLPEEVFFLEAEASVLYDRVKGRAVSESHERPEVLTLLAAVYEETLGRLEVEHSLPVTRINVTEFSQLNQLFSDWKSDV